MPRREFRHWLTREAGTSEAPALVAMDYEKELSLKNRALAAFWAAHRLPGGLEAVTASPRPRHYRTTSKRQILHRGGRYMADLQIIELETLPGDEHLYALEPEEHRAIYDRLLGFLNQTSYRVLSQHLNFIIIRGSYDRYSVIFNVDQIDAAIVRKCKLLAAHLQEMAEPVLSSFVYFDPTRSDYYFESHRPHRGVTWKKLFGPEDLTLRIGQRTFHYDATVFSQVNESMVPLLIERTASFLPALPGQRLIDLYCGYGLFALTLAERYERVIGIDASQSAIRSAEANARHFGLRETVRFHAYPVAAASLRSRLPTAGTANEDFILDPPRLGTESGVVSAIAQRRPDRVVHIFCGIERLPVELPLWQKAGYEVQRVAPLDLFPGTANLETVVYLQG